MDVRTKGNVIVNKIQVGDIHYEYEYGMMVKVKVLTLPERDEDGCWYWDALDCKSCERIQYMQNEKYPHYGPNLYDYEAYL